MDTAAAADPSCEAADPACALAPVAWPDKDCDNFGDIPNAALDCQVVDFAAAPPVLVEKLAVEDAQSDLDLLAQFWPTFVKIIRGTADSEIPAITTR